MGSVQLHPPTEGSLSEIADGVMWLRMPLPFELDHINLYLIKDNNGWVIVDCGIALPQTKALWQTIFDALDTPITRVVATHMHPDHIGLAGWLCDKWKVPLYMTQTEYFAARALFAGPAGASRWQDEQFYQRVGLDTETTHKIMGNGEGFSRVVAPLPVAYTRLKAGQTLVINDRSWKVLIGRGHSPEHACLFCDEDNILIAGDHVLPDITPNIGVYSTEPEGDTLHDYLTTLDEFTHLPDNTLVLPAHKLPFKGLHERIDELKSHHAVHLENLLAHCSQPRSLLDCLEVMFKRELSHYHLNFAIAECLSHLNYLLHRNQLKRTLGDDGIFYYTRVA